MTIPIDDSRLSKPLDNKVKRVLRAMFSKYTRVNILHEFSEGLGGSFVYKVRPIHNNGAELEAVVKIASVHEIEREMAGYEKYIKNRMPDVASIRQEPTYPPGSQLAGLWYSLAGDGVYEISSFSDYAQNHTVQECLDVFERLLTSFQALWGQSQIENDLHLKNFFDSYLPANLTIQYLPEEVSDVHFLSPGSFRLQDWQAGQIVQIFGFEPEEIDLATQRVLFNSPKGNPRFRFYLTNAPDIDGYEIGIPLQMPILGMITDTRDTFLQKKIVEIFGTAADFAQENQIVIAGTELPNPIHFYKKIVKNSYDSLTASIHGDLHLNNIMVETKRGNVHVIDFGKSRRDQILRDFFMLELSIFTSLFVDTQKDKEIKPEVIFDYLNQLHCSWVNSRDPKSSVGLETPFALTLMLRRAAQAQFFQTGNWQEYYDGLFLTFLGAIKFNNLSVVARQCVFWGAATAAALAQGNFPDCSEDTRPISPLSQTSPISELPEHVEIDRRVLQRGLVKHFSFVEMRSLPFLLDIDVDLIAGNEKLEFSINLIRYLEMRGRLRELANLCKQQRPEVAWW